MSPLPWWEQNLSLPLLTLSLSSEQLIGRLSSLPAVAHSRNFLVTFRRGGIFLTWSRDNTVYVVCFVFLQQLFAAL